MFGAIKKLIEYLVDEKILTENLYLYTKRKLNAPSPKYKEDIAKIVFTPEQYQKLFELAKHRCYLDYAIFNTMFWGMLRRCETIGMKISDIDFKNELIHIREETAKGGKKATIHIATECLNILHYYIDNIRDTPKKKKWNDILFLRNGRKLTPTSIWEIHQLYQKKLDFKVSTHMWRHTGITEYAKRQKDLKVLQRQARHSNINTTMRYINYTDDFHKDAYKDFSNSIFKPEKDTKPSQSPIKEHENQPQDTYIAKPQQQPFNDIDNEIKILQSKLNELMNKKYDKSRMEIQ
jgi:integrase